MQLFIAKNKKFGDKIAFEVIKKQIIAKPDSLIGFAVGKTTDGLHELISKDVLNYPKHWKKIKIFQIDENLGVNPKSPLSFNNEIKKELKNLFKVVNPKNVCLIDGTKNPKTTIQEGNKFIKQNKGIDLIILGLGPKYDPHIAYNTTGKSSIGSKMRVIKLHSKISKKLHENIGRSLLQQASTSRQTPTHGITLGIRDILDTKKALLIVYGKDKAKPLKLVLKKVNMKKASASALLLHKDLYIVIDRDASKLLKG